ncbi:MAG: hypothetical protein H6706_26570 [Myxococcales bacterium]|nr:hypothetical protein [Myxococcales bacterium]
MSEPARKRSGPLRRAYMIVYWVISLNLMLSVAVGVTWHVFRGPAATGPQVTEGVTPDSPEGRACFGELQGLFADLQAEVGRSLVGTVGEEALSRRWQAWTQAWRDRHDGARHRCRLDQPAMAPLAEISRDLERLRVSYSTAVKGFAATGQEPLARLQVAFRAGPTAERPAWPPSRPESPRP